MARNRITYGDELVLRDGKVGIGTTDPKANLSVFGSLDVSGDLRIVSAGVTEGEIITQKHYRDNGGSIVYQSGDQQLFSVSNEGDLAYVISDSDGTPVLQIAESGISTLKNNFNVTNNISIGGTLGLGSSAFFENSLQLPKIDFISSGSSESTRISAKHYPDNNGSVVYQSGESNLFSIDNDSDVYYSINDSEAKSALTVSSTGITTIRDLFQNTVNFTSAGSSESENIQLNHYRNIAYQPAVGVSTDNRGAISFDSLSGITTDGVTYFPASLFSLTNGGGNIFSVRGYTKQSFGGSEGSIVLDITQDGKIGIGTTNPLHDVHIVDRNIVAPNSSVTLKGVNVTGILTTPSSHVNVVRLENRVDFTDTLNPAQNTFIRLESRSTGISSSSLVGGASVFSGSITSPFNSGQLVTVENNDKTYFRINVNVLTPVSIAGTGTTFLPAGQAAIVPALDVDKYGEVRIYDTKTKPGDTFNPLPTGISTLAPNDSDLFRIDSYSTPFIGTFPTIGPAIRVDKFGYTEISRNINQISGITTVGIATTTTSLSVNATMSFELINNTTLTIKVRGTDGVTRSGIVTLA
jgi:hypothetical protein